MRNQPAVASAKAGGREYLLLFTQAKAVSEKLKKK